jgi:adenylosuccinate synthase
MGEIADCAVEADRLVIDSQAMVIEAEDLAAEATLKATIASTGKGGGSAASRRIMGRSARLEPPVRLARDVPELAPYVGSTASRLEQAFAAGKRVMLEGTQGTLLSLFHGYYPFVTSRDTTTAACLSEAGIGPHRLRRVIMVVRTYPIRVGNPANSTSGRMSQEIDWDVVAERSGLNGDDLRRVEKGSVSQTDRRVSEFDWEMLQRASELNGATDIALTFVDYLDGSNMNARRFDQLAKGTIHFVEEVSRVAGAPVSLISTGFDTRSLIDRREW